MIIVPTRTSFSNSFARAVNRKIGKNYHMWCTHLERDINYIDPKTTYNMAFRMQMKLVLNRMRPQLEVLMRLK